MVDSLDLRQARLLALRAQGLIGDKPQSVLSTFEKIHVLQIDSVNVFERAHYLPLFSRLGSYQKSELDDLTGGFEPKLIEYWAHEAAFMSTSDWPLFRHRMEASQAKRIDAPGSWGHQNRKFLDWLIAEVAEKGPLTAGEVEHDRGARTGSWWGWSDVKLGLETLFAAGHLVSGGRGKFQRTYALPNAVLSAELLAQTVPELDARKALLTQAAKSLGVATAADLIDYHRQNRAASLKPLHELVEAGDLIEMRVEDWADSSYVANGILDGINWDALAAEAEKLTTVVSPFDPIAWNRERARRLYGFDYKIEIYTPAAKRIYGYYSLPILHRGALVGRVDLKSDRAAKQLLVQSAWHEPWLNLAAQKRLASDLSAHLKTAQRWQGLESALVKPVGNLAARLKV